MAFHVGCLRGAGAVVAEHDDHHLARITELLLAREGKGL
jgi:hypothetical protein